MREDEYWLRYRIVNNHRYWLLPANLLETRDFYNADFDRSTDLPYAKKRAMRATLSDAVSPMSCRRQEEL